jgi:hypothetical protein
MKRTLSIAMLALCAAAVLFAETPQGWKLRADRSDRAEDPDAAGDIKFEKMGTGFHANNPQAAVYWKPDNIAKGNYSLKGTFTLMGSAMHTEYYGLIFGGSDLDGAGQNYIYFMVAQDGTWLVKRREGEGTQNISAKTANDVVKKPDASGKSTNTLEVRVLADKIEYLVNGTVVNTTPKTGQTAKTDGIYGIRVNHHLEVHIDGFALAKL